MEYTPVSCHLFSCQMVIPPSYMGKSTARRCDTEDGDTEDDGTEDDDTACHKSQPERWQPALKSQPERPGGVTQRRRMMTQCGRRDEKSQRVRQESEPESEVIEDYPLIGESTDIG